MFHSEVSIDLPSVETRRSMGPIEWLRSMMGAKLELPSGKEEVTIGALSLVEGIVGACKKVGITNAISFIVDRKVVYLDTQDVDDDLPLILKAAETNGILDKKFNQMHLVLTHREQGVHVLIDIEVSSQVLLGEAEMRVTATGRLEELRIQAGETA